MTCLRSETYAEISNNLFFGKFDAYIEGKEKMLFY